MKRNTIITVLLLGTILVGCGKVETPPADTQAPATYDEAVVTEPVEITTATVGTEPTTEPTTEPSEPSESGSEAP